MARNFETSNPLRRSGVRRRPAQRPPNLQNSQPGHPSNLTGAPQAQRAIDPSIVDPNHLNRLTNTTGNQPRYTQTSSANAAGAGANSMNSSASSNETEDESGSYREYTLRACSAEDLDKLRYHMIRFHGRAKVDPAEQFTPPIRFGRKDPKGLQSLIGDEQNPGGSQPGSSGASSSTNGSGNEEGEEKARKPNPFFRKKKTHQVQANGGEEGEAARRLRYEEHFPWVLEDFDSKNIWVSNYEAAQSNTYVVFVFDRDGFKMIPIEKWYKMTPRNKFVTMSLDQAEERMAKRGGSASRWIMDRLQTTQGNGAPAAPGSMSGLSESFANAANRPAPRSRMRTVEGSEERGARDADEDADFEEEFADDEEAPIMDGPEEDVKEVEERIKREQRQIGGIAEDPNDIDALFDDDDKDAIDKTGRKLRRYLRSLEKNAYYDSDDDENPYASEEDSNSDTEIKAEGEATIEANANALDSAAPAPIILPFRRKVIKSPAPGFAILQLPPALLAKMPVGEWNPGVPNRAATYAAEAAIKTEDGDQPSADSSGSGTAESGASKTSSAAAAAASTYSAERSTDPLLLTAEDVVAAIPEQGLTINELISVLKQKLKRHSDNKNRLRVILKEVVQFKDGKLMPR